MTTLQKKPRIFLALSFYPPVTLAKSWNRKVLILIYTQCCGCISAIKIPLGPLMGASWGLD